VVEVDEVVEVVEVMVQKELLQNVLLSILHQFKCEKYYHFGDDLNQILMFKIYDLVLVVTNE